MLERVKQHFADLAAETKMTSATSLMISLFLFIDIYFYSKHLFQRRPPRHSATPVLLQHYDVAAVLAVLQRC